VVRVSTPARYFGTTIPLALISTFLIGFTGLTLYSHAASFPGQVATALSQGGLIAFGITVISILNLQLLRKKTPVRTLFGTIVEGAKGAVLYLAGDQFLTITGYTTLEWTRIATLVPVLTIISFYIPQQRFEALTSKTWGRRVITALPTLLFLVLMLSGYLVEIGKTRHQELEPYPPVDIDTQYFESGFKVSFWKGIQLEAPEGVVFVVDPAAKTDLHRLWRIQVWDRYTSQDWKTSLQDTEDLLTNPDAWRDPIPAEQDEVVALENDPTIYEITIPIDHSENTAQMYQDYLPTGWWDAETYCTYITPNSLELDTEVDNKDIAFSVEPAYSTYRRGVLFEEEGISNMTYRIEYYPYNYMWPSIASVGNPDDVDVTILPQAKTYLQLPQIGGVPYPDPIEHPGVYSTASTLDAEADAEGLNVFERALRVNDFLANNYQFDNESFFGTDLAQEQPGDVDMVEWFISQGKGTHVHFASAMAVFLRHQGVPCRVVRGYAQGEDYQDVTIVRQKHIVVWVEVFIPYELEGTRKGRWRPFFPLLPLGASQDYITIVWPGLEPPPMIEAVERPFIINTGQPFPLNALILNNATDPPIPVSSVPIIFLNLKTAEILGEAVTDENGIATIETGFTLEDKQGLISLGAKTRESSPTPSIRLIVHRKYEIQWLIEPPPIVVQGRSYPLSVRLARTIDNSLIGAGINIAFGDNLYGAGAILYETPTKYWGVTNEESIAQVNFLIPEEADYPLGNHTVLAEFPIETEIVSGFSTPFFVVGKVIINPASKMAVSQSQVQVFNRIPRVILYEKPLELTINAFTLAPSDLYSKHTIICFTILFQLSKSRSKPIPDKKQWF